MQGQCKDRQSTSKGQCKHSSASTVKGPRLTQPAVGFDPPGAQDMLAPAGTKTSVSNIYIQCIYTMYIYTRALSCRVHCKMTDGTRRVRPPWMIALVVGAVGECWPWRVRWVPSQFVVGRSAHPWRLIAAPAARQRLPHARGFLPQLRRTRPYNTQSGTRRGGICEHCRSPDAA